MNEIEIFLEKENGEKTITLENEGTLILPNLEDLEVTPTKEQQVFKHENSDGYDNVIVNPIPDEYIIPDGTLPITENATFDVRKYARVSTSVHPAPNLQDKSITITENGTHSITADTDYDGLNQVNVTVNAIEDLTNELEIYNTELTKQETTLENIIEVLQTKSAGSGGEVSITKLTDFETLIKNNCDSVSNCLTEIINDYPTYTNNPITLYTPNETNKYYMIRKKNKNEYGIVWFPNLILKQTSVSLVETSNIEQYFLYNYLAEPTIQTLKTKSVTPLAYYSSNYTSFEECVEAIQSPNTVYSSTNSSTWSASMNNDSWNGYEEYHLQATNLPYINMSDEFNNTRRISSNETIEVIGG